MDSVSRRILVWYWCFQHIPVSKYIWQSRCLLAYTECLDRMAKVDTDSLEGDMVLLVDRLRILVDKSRRLNLELPCSQNVVRMDLVYNPLLRVLKERKVCI